MILDLLNNKINAMKKVRQLEAIKENHAQQVKTDQKYHDLVGRIAVASETYGYAHNHLGFLLSDMTTQKIQAVIVELRSASESGYVAKDVVDKADNDFEAIQKSIKGEWGKYFRTLTSSTTNTLNVIKGIDPTKIGQCLSDIDTAKDWPYDMAVFITLCNALDDANALISDLNMDSNIECFLEKMVKGNASIADLDNKVMAWIQSEGLAGKIKLSFSYR